MLLRKKRALFLKYNYDNLTDQNNTNNNNLIKMITIGAMT